MEINFFASLPISESSQAAEARRLGATLAADNGFDETQAGKLAIVITEICTNLLKHAGGGEILLRPVLKNDTQGIELLALDKGPGMTNVSECLRDGYSTAGSPGTGLGAIERQSAFFDLYSMPGKGTAMFLQFWVKPLKEALTLQSIEIGAVATCKRGEDVCGDGWAVKQFVDSVSLLITDGLGHGDLAAKATQEAIRIFNANNIPQPVDMLKILHQGLKSTRGAAAAVVEINAFTSAIHYAGVGNTTGSTVGEKMKHMISHNGTLGHQVPKIQEFNYNWPSDALLVFMTDGIVTQWNIDAYPGLSRRHPSLIAAVLYRDFNRGRDDATVIVAKRKAA